MSWMLGSNQEEEIALTDDHRCDHLVRDLVSNMLQLQTNNTNQSSLVEA
jgi:hypothetical protein